MPMLRPTSIKSKKIDDMFDAVGLGSLAQLHGHHGDGALVNLGAVPFAQHRVVGRARLPALTCLPTVAPEKVGRGGQHVGHTALEVAAPVAIEIDGVLVIARWQELGVADLASPAAAEL